MVKVREAVRALLDDGWTLVATRGSHRQFKHPTKAGRVTLPGHPKQPNDDLPPGLWRSIQQQAGFLKEGGR